MLNPDSGLFFCENSEVVGNVRDTDPEELYFCAAGLEGGRRHRDLLLRQNQQQCHSRVNEHL